MQYSKQNANAYSKLGIEGGTYAPALLMAGKLLDDLGGLTALDFGTGTGRTARFLKRLGAARVIAVDNNANMLAEAGTESGIDFILTDDMIPVADRTVDAALCANVFIEMGSIEQITAACREIARVLKPGAPLVVITTNPGALGANFLDYRYDPPSKDIKSGDRITCHIKGDKPFDIQDYYWTEEDYRRTFIDAGFIVEAAELPTAEGEGWLDETRVAPDIVFLLRKKN